jgi:hypothetical protein
VKRLAALVVVLLAACAPVGASTPEPGTILRVRVRTDAEALWAADQVAQYIALGDPITASKFATGLKKYLDAQVVALTTTATTAAP